MPSLHRRLALRLALGALVIGLLAGAATLTLELERVDDTIVTLASQEATAFTEQSPGVQEAARAPLIQQRLVTFLRNRQSAHQGHFLMAEIYTPARQEIAQANEGLPPDVERQVETSRHRFPPGHRSWYHKIVAHDRLYLQVLTPLFTAEGQPAGTLEGVYSIPPAELSVITGRTTAMVALVVLVVMITAATLYPIILGLHREQADLSRDLLKANLDTLAVLGSAIAKRDSDTYAHNFRVTLYALGLAERAGLPRAAIRELIKGSWLHDVGKIAISDSVLLKPGPLTDDEFALMKTHVRHGLDIVHQSQWLEGAAEVVGGHHEKWDGSGYPQGLRGEAIPLNARIFALADVFDALTSRRPYKEPMPPEQALEIMARGRGRHFDPTLFDLFIRTVGPDFQAFGGREDDRARLLLMRRAQPYYMPA